MFILDYNIQLLITILQWECIWYSCFKKKKITRKERAISVLEMLFTTVSSMSASTFQSFIQELLEQQSLFIASYGGKSLTSQQLPVSTKI